MKQLLTLFILVSFLAQTFGQAFIVADYYINTAAFAKNCENKDKPKLKCNGQCQMMKKLREQEKKDQQNSERKSAYKSISISSKSFFAVLDAKELSSPLFYITMNSPELFDRITEIFHPPQAYKCSYGCS